MKLIPANVMRLMEVAQEKAAQPGAFVLSENLGKVIGTALLSMVPMYEGRYAVPVMLGMGMPALLSYAIAVVCSTLPMPFILLLLRPVLDWFYTLPIGIVRRFAAWLERHSEKKRQSMMKVHKKGIRGWMNRNFTSDTVGLIGLYCFVAAPIPGTGCWTGSAVAALFKMNRKKAALAILLGNMTACAITLAVTAAAKTVV